MKGAEATISFENGKVLKKRERKKYRHRELDDKIRTERTRTELKLMEEAKRHGVNVPEAEEVDETTIQMEKVEGKPLKKVVEDRPDLMSEYGKNIAYLHSTDIIHGDLTTSNAIAGEKLFIIDFGLSFRSQRTEDKAVDIHLLKQVLESSHPGVAGECWEEFVEGYSEYDDSENVLEQLKDVESRGRYK